MTSNHEGESRADSVRTIARQEKGLDSSPQNYIKYNLLNVHFSTGKNFYKLKTISKSVLFCDRIGFLLVCQSLRFILADKYF